MKIKTRYGEIELIKMDRGNWEYRIRRIGTLPLHGYAGSRNDIEKESRAKLRGLYDAAKEKGLI